jgi:hypothetical protein
MQEPQERGQVGFRAAHVLCCAESVLRMPLAVHRLPCSQSCLLDTNILSSKSFSFRRWWQSVYLPLYIRCIPPQRVITLRDDGEEPPGDACRALITQLRCKHLTVRLEHPSRDIIINFIFAARTVRREKGLR